MLKVDNFLIIFSLEVGGKFIGWFGVITNVIVLPLCFVLLIGICVDKDLKFIREQLDSIGFQTMNMSEVTEEKAIKHLREYFLVTLILVVIISSIYLVASVLLIRGTNNVCLPRENFNSWKFFEWFIFIFSATSDKSRQQKTFWHSWRFSPYSDFL